jgi:hypothetical protein
VLLRPRRHQPRYRHAAESSVMNSRRFMGAPSSGLGPHITTPLRKNAAVHHGKNCALMSQWVNNGPEPDAPLSPFYLQ